jgi:RNA polymerase sigma factor (sigma-70 family)
VDNQTDQQLLRAYVSHRSEAAFTELVHRYIDLVYSTARRLLGDAFRAEDVTQATFMALAQNAKSLANRAVLSGWLHTTAHHLAIKTIRTDARRQQREKEVATMNESTHAPAAASWQEIAPHLDALIGKLAESERDAILLRYFEKKSAVEMAASLGISADAAQKRVNRAVEKLRNLFSKHGINIGAGGLGILISTHAVQTAPAGLALTISSVALAGTAATTSTLITATKTMAMTTLQKTLVTTTVAVLAGVGLYEAKQVHNARAEVQTLRQQQALLEEQVQRLENDFAAATNRLSNLLAENTSLKSNPERNELLKLRGEVTRLRSLEKDINALQKSSKSIGFRIGRVATE